MQTILLASGNAKKLAELRALVADLPLRFLSPGDLPQGLSEVDEDQPDFLGNAKKKALAAAADVAAQFGGGAGGGAVEGEIWVLADDSGLCVDALDGAPGVYSARYAGVEGIGKDAANNEKLLHALGEVADADRGAAFHCVIALARNEKVVFTLEGSVRGRILRNADGVDGFGYDPLFFHPPSNTSFARLSAAEKAEVSHRGMAVRKLRARLMALLPALFLSGVSCAYLPSSSGEFVNTPYISRTTGVGVADQGVFELEGLMQTDPGDRVKSLVKANFGLGPGFELGIAMEPYHASGSGPNGRGVGDLSIAAKYQFADGSKGDLRGILETEVRLPTSDAGPAGSNGESDFFLITSLGQAYGKFSLVGTYELGLLGEAGHDAPLVEHNGILAASFRLHSKLRAFVEASVVHEPRDSITAWYGGGGAGVKVSGDIELQAALQLGLNDRAEDYLVVVGFTYEVGHVLPVMR